MHDLPLVELLVEAERLIKEGMVGVPRSQLALRRERVLSLRKKTFFRYMCRWSCPQCLSCTG